MGLDSFIAKWCSADYPPHAVAGRDLDYVEHHFNFTFPADYRREVLACGLPRPTIALLNSIVDHGLEIHDLSEFLAPEEIIETTDGWRPQGLPNTAVAFATDGCGNLFFFDRRKSGVWFFDHDFAFDEDFEYVYRIADSFTALIAELCEAPLPHTSEA